MTKAKPHAALLASPGMGHLIPVLELAKRMVTHHDFHVTVFVVRSSHSSNSLLKSPTPNNLDIVALPSVDISSLVDPNSTMVAKLVVIMRESLPSLRSSIAAMKIFRPTALVVDLFGADAFAIADEFGMLRYMFDTTTAWFLAVTLYSSSIDKKLILEDHVKRQKPLKIPGCKSLRFEDTLESLTNIDMFDGFQIMGTNMTKIDGIFVNTWEDLESTTIEALGDNNFFGSVAKVPIYPVGPLVRKDGKQVLDEQFKAWLDKQPAESVIYVSFGSGGTLSGKQITELAWGLEQSQQRFIWVIRPPSENAIGAYFTIGENYDVDGTPDYLPEGFFTRTKNIGLVIPMWAPQAQILSHPSVGGFLSHCGWNSTLESISNGVPMIAWPLYAEQKMNAAMLTEDFGIAVRPNVSPSEKIVGRVEIEKVVRKIMVDKEGLEMRERVNELKNSGEKALSKGGSSYNSLSLVAKDCLNRLHA